MKMIKVFHATHMTEVKHALSPLARERGGHLGNLHVGGRVMSKWVLKEQDIRLCRKRLVQDGG
jgi:hypothetical protein